MNWDDSGCTANIVLEQVYDYLKNKKRTALEHELFIELPLVNEENYFSISRFKYIKELLIKTNFLSCIYGLNFFPPAQKNYLPQWVKCPICGKSASIEKKKLIELCFKRCSTKKEGK